MTCREGPAGTVHCGEGDPPRLDAARLETECRKAKLWSLMDDALSLYYNELYDRCRSAECPTCREYIAKCKACAELAEEEKCAGDCADCPGCSE